MAGVAVRFAGVFFAGVFAAVFVAGAAFLAGAFAATGMLAGPAFFVPDVVARATAALTDFTVDRTAEPTLEVVDRAGLGSAAVAAFGAAGVAFLVAVVAGAAFRAAVFLAAAVFAPAFPDAALLATIGPRPFVAHAVDVDKWGRQ